MLQSSSRLTLRACRATSARLVTVVGATAHSQQRPTLAQTSLSTTSSTSKHTPIHRRAFHSTPPTNMASKRDHYDVLGVDKNADAKEIKRAYYKLAKQHHPDTNKGDKTAEKKFTEVSNSYEVLADKEKREAYDQFGHDAEQMGGMGGGGFGGGGGGGFSHAQDIFEQLFRQQQGGGGGGGFGGMGGGNPFGQVRLFRRHNMRAHLLHMYSHTYTTSSSSIFHFIFSRAFFCQGFGGGMGGMGGGGGGGRMRTRGEDRKYSMPLTFMEAVEGTKKT
jgi:DnaJ-class molecular chaperone